MNIISAEIPKAKSVSANIEKMGPGSHTLLTDRSAADQHPISAITGLQAALDRNKGADGKSAYQIAVDNGFKGSEQEWLESLKGEQGHQGEPGPQGPPGEPETIPDTLPNPYSLKLIGAVSAEYDGTKPVTVNIPAGGGGSGGTADHTQLVNRDAADQHPISAITGLQPALDALRIVETATGDSIALTDSSNNPLKGLTLYGKSTQDGTPSPENPIPLVSAGDGGRINVSVVGKNLLPYPYPFVTSTTNGVTATVNNDGSVTLSGTATADTYIYLTQYSAAYNIGFNAPAGTVYVSGCPAGGSTDSYRIQVSAYKNGVYATGASDIGNGASFQNEEGTVCACYIHVRADTNVDGLTFRPMISMEQGAAFTQTVAQILAAQTPNGLNGVPVTSGGNYTDESGQQWICDEIDFERGVYVQNTRRFTINGSEAQSITSISVRQNTVRFWVYGANPGGGGVLLAKANNTILCDKLPYGYSFTAGHDSISIMCGVSAGYPTSFVLSLPIAVGTTAEAIKTHLATNPLDVVYAIDSPIETPLTATEIAAYKALHTNNPVTTILNDGGAGMSLTYVPYNKSSDYIGSISSTVIPVHNAVTNDTLLVINPDAAPDKIPQWYNGTAVTGAGQTVVSGSAAGDYYINSATFDVYHATAPDTWAYVGNIKGDNGSAGIFFGAYDGSDGQPPEDAVLWIDPNEAASAELITTAGLADALTGINNRIQYYEDTEINANVTRVYRIGNVLVQAGLVQPKVTTRNTPVTTPVYFSSALGRYLFAPTVLTDASASNPLTVASGIGGTPTEQFTAYANRSDAAGSVNVRWQAIGICE